MPSGSKPCRKPRHKWRDIPIFTDLNLHMSEIDTNIKLSKPDPIDP